MARRTTKITLAIGEDQIILLDRLTIDIRASTGTIITRGEVVRAIIDAVQLTELNLGSIKCEDDVRCAIANRLLDVAR